MADPVSALGPLRAGIKVGGHELLGVLWGGGWGQADELLLGQDTAQALGVAQGAAPEALVHAGGPGGALGAVHGVHKLLGDRGGGQVHGLGGDAAANVQVQLDAEEGGAASRGGGDLDGVGAAGSLRGDVKAAACRDGAGCDGALDVEVARVANVASLGDKRDAQVLHHHLEAAASHRILGRGASRDVDRVARRNLACNVDRGHRDLTRAAARERHVGCCSHSQERSKRCHCNKTTSHC